MEKFKKNLHSTFYILHSRRGFTLIELLLFSVIFSIVVVAFTTIFVSVMRVQVRQSAAAEVNQQSQFLLQTVERYVEQSSAVDMTTDVSGNQLKLRMASSTMDPAYIYLSSGGFRDGLSQASGTVYLKLTDSGVAQPLTSPRVVVTSLSFTKRENGAGHHSVAVSFAVQYNTPNIQQQFSQALQTAVTRVSAATFDSNIVPVSSGSYTLGVANQDWRSINSTIYFNGANVGVGVLSPNAKLQVSGGDIYADTVGNGIILRSPDGNCWRVTVANGGSLATTSVACP